MGVSAAAGGDDFIGKMAGFGESKAQRAPLWGRPGGLSGLVVFR